MIRLGSCKRSAAELVRDLPVFHGHVQRFLSQFPSYAGWRVERVSLAPQVPQDVRQVGPSGTTELPLKKRSFLIIYTRIHGGLSG